MSRLVDLNLLDHLSLISTCNIGLVCNKIMVFVHFMSHETEVIPQDMCWFLECATLSTFNSFLYKTNDFSLLVIAGIKDDIFVARSLKL